MPEIRDSSATTQDDIFVSHIVPEKAIALVLQQVVREAFRNEVAVFVSSDQTSIGGGPEWYQHIMSCLGKATVLLVLVSQESAGTAWVNFEAGFGRGNNATVIPIAIRDFTFDRLPFPLTGINGRYISDIEGILYDISRATKRVGEPVDAAVYREAILAAEASVTYKSIIVTPYHSPGIGLKFAIENNGNTDVDLLALEVWVPKQLVPNQWPRSAFANVLNFDFSMLDGHPHVRALYSSTISNHPNAVESLRPVLTRSMGRILPEYPVIPMVFPTLTIDQWEEAPAGAQDLLVKYQVHARHHDTVREAKRIGDVGLLRL